MTAAHDPRYPAARVPSGARAALWLLPAALAGWILWTVLSSPVPPPLPTLGDGRYGMNAENRREALEALASHEARWRRLGKRKFKDSPWSADDDYHWHRQSHIEHKMGHTAGRKRGMWPGVPPSHFWALVDEACREGWRSKKHKVQFSVTVPPLEPRKK